MQRKVDSQRMATASRSIRENISRAKGYLRRDDLERAISCAKDALVQKNTAATLGLGRSEVELLFGELCEDLRRHPKVVALLESLGVRPGQFLRYTPGEEMLLVKKLTAFQLKKEEIEQRERQQAESKRASQKAEWLAAGRQLLAQKNFPKGKVMLRRVAETFGEEPDVAREVGELFAEAGLVNEALEMYGLAIQRFPGDGKAWRLAIATCDVLGEFQKAETFYLEALKLFGAHPMTYLNMAKFYLKWHRKDDAYEYAERALALDPNLAEAQEIRDKIG
jgi:tetratricopeptide (TPR) repeat protein